MKNKIVGIIMLCITAIPLLLFEFGKIDLYIILGYILLILGLTYYFITRKKNCFFL